MRKTILTAAFAAILLSPSTGASAAEGVELPEQDWSFAGLFGTFDRAAAQRGLQVYQESCSGCHSLRLVAYRNLADLGYDDDQIKAIAAEKEVEDGPDDEGEMFMRPALASDRFVSPYRNEQEGRAFNGGALPPDLSLMTKSRVGGADYVYAILIGYSDDVPEDVEVMEGMNYNAYFPGLQIAMPPPLFEDGIEYADGTAATVEQMAHDVVTFLAWAAEPELEARKRMGVKVILFLLVLTALLYATKRKIWGDLH